MVFTVLVFFLFGLPVGRLHSYEKKLKIVTEKAYVHLDPDKRSTVVAMLKRGTLVSLGSERKFRTNWNYIYFASEKTGRTKSGYILDSFVEKQFEVTKKTTIQREGDDAGSGAEFKANFRSTSWGMNKAQVVRLEGNPALRENSEGLDIIQYSQKILNMDCMIGYIFADNKLAKAKYSFLAKHSDKSRYFQDFEKIGDILTQKYGKPEAEKMLWHNNAYRNDRSNWGMALGRGHLELNSRWRDSETEIQLRLYGEGDRVFLVVLYSGLRYVDLAAKAKAQSRLSIW